MDESSGRVALVTGARGGIGSQVAHQLKIAGYRVAAVGRDLQSLGSVPADTHLAFDVTEPGAAAAAIEACRAALGAPPSALAHCVGSTLITPLHRTTDVQYREVMRVNLDSAFYMLQAWVDAMRVAGTRGAAVLASSVVARIGVANHEAIAAAKGGVEALARSAAATYAPVGLRINAVAPGLTETSMTARMLQSDPMREAAGKQYPLGGVQTAAEVAATIAWLLSDAATRITGQVIPVDGGFTTIRPLVK